MKSHHIRLIDNTYTVDEAHDVLLSLIEDKIRFLKYKLFSIEEQTGKIPVHMKTRVAELKQEIIDLKNFLKSFDGDDAEVNIGCTIAINVNNAELV